LSHLAGTRFRGSGRETTGSPSGSPSPNRPATRGKGKGKDYRPSVQHEVWSILLGGLHSLSLNDYGRPWPHPRRRVLAQLVAQHNADLCVRAAWEAREIVQAQDRAPNITALFEKKLRELADVRAAVRGSLENAGG